MFLFGGLQVLPGALQGLLKKDHDVFSLIGTFASMCDFVYFYCDNSTFLAEYGLLAMTEDRKSRLYGIAVKMWVISSLISVVQTLKDMSDLKKEKEVDEPMVSHKKRSLVETCLNIMLGLYFIFPNNGIISADSVGIIGFLAGLIGCIDYYKGVGF